MKEAFFLFFLLAFHGSYSMLPFKQTSKNKRPFIYIDGAFKPKLAPWQKFNKKITHQYTVMGEIVGNIACNIALALIMNKICVIVHELSHAVSKKYLFNSSPMLYIPFSLIENIGAVIDFESPPGIKSAFTEAAGPLAGMAMSYLFLKIESIIEEFVDDKKNSYREKIMKGINKPTLINLPFDILYSYEKPVSAIKVVATCCLLSQISQFIPRKVALSNYFLNNYDIQYATSDGYKVLENLGFYK